MAWSGQQSGEAGKLWSTLGKPMNMKNKILVVDDDPRLLRFVRANLESRGYRGTPAFEGVGALEAIEQEMPELIVLDIMLPGEFDGYELCARVRQFSTVP